MRSKRALILIGLLLATITTSGCLERASYWGSPGIYGSVLLSQGDEILIEVDFMEGAAPNAEALGQFRKEVEDITGKEVIIEYSDQNFTLSGSGEDYDFRMKGQKMDALAAIKSIGEKFRDHQNGLFPMMDKKQSIYVLYLGGEIVESEGGVPGMVFSADSICVFPEVLNSAHFGFIQREETRKNMETTILLHEFGHLLSLARRSDLREYWAERQGYDNHCSDPDCVMYWQMSWDGNRYDAYKNGYKHLCEDCMKELDSYRY